MRSLTGKLTVAFLIVGILGAVLVAIFILRSGQRDFAQFVIGANERNFQRQLADIYQINGNSWGDIERQINRRRNSQNNGPDHGPPRGRFYGTLADADGNVLVNLPRKEREPRLTESEQARAKPILVENEIVGWMLLTPPPDLLEGQLERFFLTRFGRAVVIGALCGALLALIAGALLARTLTKPLHQLTTATKTLAQGDLGVQVDVQSDDEIGQLADSFNTMSAQLAKSNELRQQMTADIAHDLRTPLSVILGYTEALNEGKLSGNAEMYEVLHRQAHQLSHLIEELRTLSLADAGKLTLHKQSISVSGLLEEIHRAHQVEADDQGIELKVSLEESLPNVSLDRDRMTQVLGNLVKNALHHTPVNGVITLGATANGEQMEISVADTGSGIAPDDLPSIFERFYQADKNRSEEGASGLGLPIAKSIVEAHGGVITAESVLGKGSTFRILLSV